MNKTLIVIIAFGLVGCKSLDYVRSTTPVLKGETSKSVADFTACIIEMEWKRRIPHVLTNS